MADLRDDLLRLAEEMDRAGDAADDCCYSLMRDFAAKARSLLARHPAPSPSVSRDAETCRERSGVGHGCRREAGHEGRHRDRHGNEWAAPSPRSEAEGAAHLWIETSDPMTPMCSACKVRDGDPAADQPCHAPVPAESATTAKCANRYHPFCDEAGAGGCYPCRACGGKTEISYPTADGLKWRPCPECGSAATKGEENGR